MATSFPTLLKELSDDLEAIGKPATVATVDLEFGYSYLGHIGEGNGYEAVETVAGVSWFATVEDAQAAKDADTRWRSELFLISRPKPQPARRVELPLGYRVR